MAGDFVSYIWFYRTMSVVVVGLVVLWYLLSGCVCDNTRRHLDVDCTRWVDVAIVGAGPAGSYSAYKLRDAGLTVELLEYSDRIGGRVFTTSLPNIPDLKLELGAMRYIEGRHSRVQRLVQELNLTPVEFVQRAGTSKEMKYFLRNQVFRPDDLKSDAVPYNLSPQEKKYQDSIAKYYLYKLTGHSDTLAAESAFKLKVKDGRELYKLTMSEALDTVATPGGRHFLKETSVYDGAFSGDISALEFFVYYHVKTLQNLTIMTLKEGMDSLPKHLVRAFLESSTRHKMTFNRKLDAIHNIIDGRYQLQFSTTSTDHGHTTVTGPGESVCTSRVILAITQLALTKLKWNPLRSSKVTKALHAVIPVKSNKVFLTFPKAWWLSGTTGTVLAIESDLPFRKMFDWKSSSVTGDCAMLASYSDTDSTSDMQNMNSQGGLVSGPLPGNSTVSDRLKQELISQLAQSFGVNRSVIPEPISGVSQFWTSYPYGGGWTVWRAGYNINDVIQTIQRPSVIDDVYIVGSDYGFVGSTMWTDGAFKVVDEVFDKYFT